MPFASELQKQADSLREQLVAAGEAAGTGPLSAEDVEKATKMHDDLSGIVDRLTLLKKLDQGVDDAKVALEASKEAKEQLTFVPFNGQRTQSKSIPVASNGQRLNGSAIDNFLESTQYKQFVAKGHPPNVTYSVEVPGSIKAAGDPITSAQFGTRGTDSTVPPHYSPMPTVADLMRTVSWPSASVRYYQATMPLTNSAAFIAEAATKPEVQPRWTIVDAPIETVAEWTAVTLQALDDVPALRAVLEDDLRRLLLLKIDEKLLTGTGTPPEIRGILNTTGIQTQAFTTDAITSLSAGITKVVSSGAGYPTGVVMHPDNWQTVRMTSSNGIWYFGGPAEAGVSRIFGIPVIPSTSMTTGFALVGDFSFATIFERWGVTFIVGLKDDDLIKNMQTIVCEARLTLAVRRPTAFCNTDIVTP